MSPDPGVTLSHGASLKTGRPDSSRYAVWLFCDTVHRLPAASSSMPAPLPPGSGWKTTERISQVAGSIRKMSSNSEFVAIHSRSNDGFHASPEMLGSAGAQLDSVSPGVGH